MASDFYLKNSTIWQNFICVYRRKPHYLNKNADFADFFNLSFLEMDIDLFI